MVKIKVCVCKMKALDETKNKWILKFVVHE
jgi:hypothetical protein